MLLPEPITWRISVFLRRRKGLERARPTVVTGEDPALALLDRPVDLLQDPPLRLPLTRPPVRDVNSLELDERPPRPTCGIGALFSLERLLPPSCPFPLQAGPLGRACLEHCLRFGSSKHVVLGAEEQAVAVGSDVGQSEVCDEFGKSVLRSEDKQDARRALGVERGEEL